MNRTRIKICGITRVEDALAAAEAGADAIGVVMQRGSARFIDQRAREVVEALPAFVTPVAVFVNEAHPAVAAHQVGIEHVQLHGTETRQDVERIHGVRVIKAVRLTRENIATELEQWRWNRLSGIVLETPRTDAPGGTGIANDWSFIAEAKRAGKFDGMPSLILAGGLTPESVGDVVRSIRPWAVDVSSGVESSIGIKSMEKIRAFISAVRAADEDV